MASYITAPPAANAFAILYKVYFSNATLRGHILLVYKHIPLAARVCFYNILQQ